MKRSVMMLSAGAVALMLSSGAWASGTEHAAHLDPAQIAAAKTPADHAAIAKAYEAEAVEADTKATVHEGMARAYRGGSPSKGSYTTMARHCSNLAKQYRDAAEENRKLAAAHRQMAKDCCAQK